MATSYAIKNPRRNIIRLTKGISHFASNPIQKEALSSFYNKDSMVFENLARALENLNPKCSKKLITNFGVNSAMTGIAKNQKLMKKYEINIPLAILMDPTSACNLHCTGCWAAEYGKSNNLSFDLMDRIIREGKELGTYWYLFSGGEPTLRRKELIQLARKHNDCYFLAFTNGTMIDEKFAKELAEVGNFTLAVSVEGFEEETDFRRGKGTYRKLIQGMKLLKKYGVMFGISTCYHKKNTECIGSEEFVDYMIELGATYAWLFTYIPIGKDAVVDLIATPEQREFMFHQVRKFRKTKPLFFMDFWNDGDSAHGCIAGGRSYLHINARGDVEPCAFIHYADVNIHDVSLLEALKSPLFEQYRINQPFNKNYLQPCPLLDNPDKLKEMVHKSHAKSTQLLDEESVDDLTDKCQECSKKWAPVANRIVVEHADKLSPHANIYPPRYWDKMWDGKPEYFKNDSDKVKKVKKMNIN
ncbi:MAG: radical SAM protein [Promethearchaeota archaeon]